MHISQEELGVYVGAARESVKFSVVALPAVIVTESVRLV